jgi:hypothetical protein
MRALVGILALATLVLGQPGEPDEPTGTVRQTGVRARDVSRAQRPATRPAPAAQRDRLPAGPRRQRLFGSRLETEDDWTRRPAAQPDEPLTPEQVDRIMSFTRENFPGIHERLSRLREVAPADFQQMIRRARQPLAAMLDAQTRDPQLARQMIAEQRLRMEIDELARRYQRASRAEQGVLREQIADRLRERFDVEQNRLRGQINQLRRRLDEQERRLEHREEQKEGLLDQELSGILQGRAKTRPRTMRPWGG